MPSVLWQHGQESDRSVPKNRRAAKLWRAGQSPCLGNKTVNLLTEGWMSQAPSCKHGRTAPTTSRSCGLVGGEEITLFPPTSVLLLYSSSNQESGTSMSPRQHSRANPVVGGVGEPSLKELRR